jgi:hypothetical protein
MAAGLASSTDVKEGKVEQARDVVMAGTRGDGRVGTSRSPP